MAIVLSAALHAVVFFGIGPKPKAVPRPVEENLIAVTIEMPKLADLEDIDRAPNDDAGERPDIGEPVPMQADVPQLPSPSDFVQQIDYASLVQKPDLTTARLLAIPDHILRGVRIDKKLGNIFNLADLDRVPEAVVQPAPIFPPTMKREEVLGIVRVEFIVDANGRVVNPYVVESSNRGFDDAAVLGVAKWRFRPGIKGGRKVNTRMQVPIVFRLVDDAS